MLGYNEATMRSIHTLLRLQRGPVHTHCERTKPNCIARCRAYCWSMGRVGAGNKMKDRCGIAVTQFAAIAHKRKGPASLSTDIRTAGPCATRSRQQDSVHTGHAGSTRAQAITARSKPNCIARCRAYCWSHGTRAARGHRPSQRV